MSETKLQAVLAAIVLEDEQKIIMLPCLIGEDALKRRRHPENQKVFNAKNEQELRKLVDGVSPEGIYNILCEKFWGKERIAMDFTIALGEWDEGW